MIHSLKYKKPIVTFDMTPDFANLVVGMSDGTFSIRQNKSKQVLVAPEDPMAGLKFDLGIKKQVLSYKFFNRGVYSKNEESADSLVKFIASKQMKKYDTFLKKFKYGEALKHALTTKDSQVIVAVIEELVYRNGVQIAIKNLEGEDVKLLLDFVYKKCDSTNHQSVVLYIFEQFLGLLDRGERFEDQKIDLLLLKIKEKLEAEERIAAEASELGGMLEVLESMA